MPSSRPAGLRLARLATLIFLFAAGPASGADNPTDRLSDSPQAVALYEEGMQLARQDKLKEALGRFRQAIAADSTFVQAHLRYMDALQSVDRGGEVEEMYRKKCEQNPESALYHFLHGRSMSDMSAKRVEFRAALSHDPNFYWAQYGIGGSYLVERSYEEAITALRETLRLNPRMLDAKRLLGVVYLEKGAPAQAREQFESALAQDSTDTVVGMRLGQVYSQLEQYELADRTFRRVAALSRKDPVVYYYIGMVNELGGHPELAVEAYGKFLELAPGHELAGSVTRTLARLKK
jgi:tetratricopeptide (TPR) repeat protein